MIPAEDRGTAVELSPRSQVVSAAHFPALSKTTTRMPLRLLAILDSPRLGV